VFKLSENFSEYLKNTGFVYVMITPDVTSMKAAKSFGISYFWFKCAVKYYVFKNDFKLR
jgi:hypothetical protein